MNQNRIYVFLIISIILVLLAALGFLFNKMNRNRAKVRQAWSNIEVYQRQRLDELDSQLAQLERFFAYEHRLQLDIVRVRARISEALESGEPNHNILADNHSRRLLSNIRLENYPEISAWKQSLHMAERTSVIEDEINAARRVFNANATEYNLLLENVPTNMLAPFLGHREKYELFSS